MSASSPRVEISPACGDGRPLLARYVALPPEEARGRVTHPQRVGPCTAPRVPARPARPGRKHGPARNTAGPGTRPDWPARPARVHGPPGRMHLRVRPEEQEARAAATEHLVLDRSDQGSGHKISRAQDQGSTDPVMAARAGSRATLGRPGPGRAQGPPGRLSLSLSLSLSLAARAGSRATLGSVAPTAPMLWGTASMLLLLLSSTGIDATATEQQRDRCCCC